MKKKVFLTVISIMILLPGIFTRFGKDTVSEIDNRMLKDFSSAEGDTIFQKIDNVLEDRVGFREELITVNETVTDVFFHKMVHPLYIYGKDGHLFTEWDLSVYQHKDSIPGYAEDFAGYLKSVDDYCKSIGTEFIFIMPPDKETIYPEFYADGYNVKDQKNRTELIMEELDKEGIAHIFPRDLFLELKEKELLYNRIYDVGHWNDTGMFYACKELFSFLHSKNNNIRELNISDFLISSQTEKYLPQSREYKPDIVPVFENSLPEMQNDAADFYNNEIKLNHTEYEYHAKNMDKSDKPRILVVEDSFFGQRDAFKYFYGNCSELFMIHAMNLGDLEYYLSVIKPDIFILECCERGPETGGVYGADYLKKRQYIEGENEDLFDIIKCPSEKLGLEDSYFIKGENREYVGITGKYSEDLEFPVMTMARLGDKIYFGHDDDYFNPDKRKLTFTFKMEDIKDENKNCIEYYLIYQKNEE